MKKYIKYLRQQHLLSFKIVPTIHRNIEGGGITLVTTRYFFVMWFLGINLTCNISRRGSVELDQECQDISDLKGATILTILR